MNATLLTILGFGFLMSLIAVIGGLFVLLPEAVLRRWLKPLVAFAAGALLGGAFFHMLPRAMGATGPQSLVMLWVVVGFTVIFALDQLLEWHHCRLCLRRRSLPSRAALGCRQARPKREE